MHGITEALTSFADPPASRLVCWSLHYCYLIVRFPAWQPYHLNSRFLSHPLPNDDFFFFCCIDDCFRGSLSDEGR